MTLNVLVSLQYHLEECIMLFSFSDLGTRERNWGLQFN